MNTSNSKFLIGGLILALVLVFTVWHFLGGSNGIDVGVENQAVTADPVDVTLEFYKEWLAALQATDTDPFAAGLQDTALLGESVRNQLTAIRDREEQPEIDPVLCQIAVPEKIGAKLLYRKDDKAQVMVIARKSDLQGQAVVTLVPADGEWSIIDITCGSGEFAPQGEFSFEREGQLLKSVPPPYNPEYWHLVYEDGGVMGFVAPLHFNVESVCVNVAGVEGPCDENSFQQTTKAFIQGDMSETGVDVVRLELR